jgi:hypothetical protein
MTDQQKRLRDIDTLRESIRLNYADLNKMVLTGVERAGIRQHIGWCIKDLTELLTRLDSAPQSN